MQFAQNINILIDIRGNLDQGSRFSGCLVFLPYFRYFQHYNVTMQYFLEHTWTDCVSYNYENIGMIDVYENRAELPSRDVNCTECAKLFDLHP